MSLQGLLNTTVNIQTEAATKTGRGFASEGTYTVKASGVPCRVTDQTPQRAAMIYGKFDATSQKRVYFASEQSLDVNDRLQWVDLSGKAWTLYVHSVENQGGSLNRVWAVDVATYPTAA